MNYFIVMDCKIFCPNFPIFLKVFQTWNNFKVLLKEQEQST